MIASWVQSNEMLLRKTSDEKVLRIIRSNVKLKGIGMNTFFKSAIENIGGFNQFSFSRSESLLNGKY